MKINMDMLSYKPEDWEKVSERFVPLVFENLETGDRAKFANDILNFKSPQSYSLSYAETLMLNSIKVIQFNVWDALLSTAQLGEKYAQIALKKDCRLVCAGKKGKYSEIGAKTLQYDLLLFFDWVLLKKTNKEYIDGLYEVIKRIYYEKLDEKNDDSKKIPFNFLVNAFYLLLYGNLELAELIGKDYMRCKKTRYLTEKVIYDRKKFYSYILGAVISPSNEEFKKEVERIMLYFLEERRKGNTILKRSVYGFTTVPDINIIILWYKYFSDYNFKEISPYEIIQACRYGVRGHEDMEQLRREGKEREWWKKFYQ